MKKCILPVVIATAMLLAGAAISFAQALTIEISNCPQSAKAGQDLLPAFQVSVTNKGDKAVKDAQINMILKKSVLCPPAGRPAVYAPDYFDGVLLRDGRQFFSVDPGQTVAIKPYGAYIIPANTPVGRSYFICAVIAAGNREKGENEPAQCACCPVKIIGVEARPEITGFADTCVARGATVTIRGRNLGTGASKTVVLEVDGMNMDLSVISWGDTAIVARVPDASGIRDGKDYNIGIQRSDHSELLSNRKSVAVCPSRKQPKSPPDYPSVSPIPPFLF